jgi:hypothetical protein
MYKAYLSQTVNIKKNLKRRERGEEILSYLKDM